jgi:Cellulose binding domain
MFRRLMLFAVTMAVLPLGAMLAPGATTAAQAATCTGGVAVSQFAFNPPSVAPGGSSALTLVLSNCTSQTIQGSTDWYGTYTGSGCPVLDPVPYSYTIAPGGTYTLTNTYGDPGFSGCQPSALRINANVNVNGAGTVTTASATLQFSSSCVNGVAIQQLSFNPPAVPAGQRSTLTLVLANCTNQPIQGGITSYGRYTWAGGSGIPPGCPAIDPISYPYSIAAGGTFTHTEQQGDTFQSCPATGLTWTMNVTVNGVTGTAATASANLVIQQPTSPPPTSPPPSGSCHVTYTPSNWQGGFTANVTISNSGSTAINGWTLTFAFPGDEQVTNAWNATVSQTGQNVSAKNVSYNATIPAGGSQSFGFQGTWTANDASPTSFSVNGVACS